MKTWLRSLFKRRKEPRRSPRVVRSVVEEKVIQHVQSIVMTACSEFAKSGYAGKSIVNTDMARRMSALMYRIENHLYDDLGTRITLGNTTLCGGTIRTLATGKDQNGYPRSQYKLQLPLYGRVVFEFSAVATIIDGHTIVRPHGKMYITAFDIIEFDEIDRLINLEIRDVVDTATFGW